MENSSTTVAVLVSLYGDSPYLKAFLESIAGQSFRDFRLLCRFDGTPSAAVRALLNQYSFVQIVDNEEFCGIPNTYWALLHHASAYPYVMFADQDDIWHTDKIEKSIAAMHQMELRYGKVLPLLIHSDLAVIHADGRLMARSFIRYQSLNPRRNSLADLMIQNNVTGCTMLMNHALTRRMTQAVPAICHDWYMALIAAAFGKIGFIREALIDYRQHSRNYFGAVPLKTMPQHFFARKKLHGRLVQTQKQARLFAAAYRAELAPEQIAILEAWGRKIPECTYFKRLRMALKFHFRKNNRLRTLGMWWAL